MSWAGGCATETRGAMLAAREASLRFAARWHDHSACRKLAGSFSGVTSEADGVAAAEALLSDTDWLVDYFDALTERLASDPYFEPPFAVGRDAVQASAILFENMVATVTATVTSAVGLASAGLPDAVAVSGQIRLTRYLRAGGARLRRWQVEAAPDDFSASRAQPARELTPLALTDGLIVRCDGRRRADLLVGARSDVVAVTVALHVGRSPLVREYRCSDGMLLRVSPRDKGAARAMMLLALLSESGRGDPEAFDPISRDDAFFLRWEAMRQWLSVDWAAALPRLREMAERDPHDEVRGAAAQTQDRIMARLEALPCPA